VFLNGLIWLPTIPMDMISLDWVLKFEEGDRALV
jgi:hypothetical protein